MYLMYLDESGDHSLDKIDPQFPIFVLAGCIFARQDHDGRVTTEMAEYKQGQMVAESRNPTLDKQLDLTFQLLMTRGTRFVRPSALRQRITGLSFRLKQENIAGLQVADLVATPIARAVLGKDIKEDYRIVEAKFRRRGGSHLGAGLVVLPK